MLPRVPIPALPPQLVLPLAQIRALLFLTHQQRPALQYQQSHQEQPLRALVLSAAPQRHWRPPASKQLKNLTVKKKRYAYIYPCITHP